MKFKVGDRVKVVEPAECVEDPNNRLGTGTILDADDREYFYVKVDSNTKPWWYAERCLRALPTPSPSITVGTQVRLTGVVEPDPAEGGGGIYLRTAGGHSVYLNSSAKEDLEVIRQPFKRGEEVAYDHVLDNADDDEWALVIRDEGPDGMFWMVYKHLEAKVHQRHFSEFKRRPERRP